MTDSVNPCGFCKTKNSKIQYPVSDIFGHNFNINKCNNCNAFFLSPFPTLQQLEMAYDSSYYGSNEKKFSFPIIENVLDYFRSGRARKLAKYLKENDNVLDIGCGNGRFLMYLKKLGNYNLFGTELPGNSAERTSKIKEINLKIGMLEYADFKPTTFSAITLFHVFEHLTEPKAILEIISIIIKPNGILIMSFPNIDSIQSKWFKGKWLHLDPPRHLFFFASNDFEKLLNSYGFDLINKKFMSFEQNPYGMVQSILNKIIKKREVLFERLKGNKQYAQEYSSVNILLQKLFFIATMPIFMITDIFVSIARRGATVEFTFKKKG